jgi:hypothetical protein
LNSLEYDPRKCSLQEEVLGLFYVEELGNILLVKLDPF